MSVLTLRKRIIYDTHGANIYINICTTKIFIEKVKMTISYQEEINMSRIESGRTNLTVKTMCIICNALNVNLRDIIR